MKIVLAHVVRHRERRAVPEDIECEGPFVLEEMDNGGQSGRIVHLQAVDSFDNIPGEQAQLPVEAEKVDRIQVNALHSTIHEERTGLPMHEEMSAVVVGIDQQLTIDLFATAR